MIITQSAGLHDDTNIFIPLAMPSKSDDIPANPEIKNKIGLKRTTPLDSGANALLLSRSQIQARAGTQDKLYLEADFIFQSFLSSFVEAKGEVFFVHEPLDTQNYRETVIKSLRDLQKNLRDVTQVIPLEKKVKDQIETLNDNLKTFEYLVTIYEDSKKDEILHEIVQGGLTQTLTRCEEIHVWMKENHLFSFYWEIKELLEKTAKPYNAISGGLPPRKIEYVRKPEINTFPSEKTFIGRIEKDDKEGNGLYITDVASIYGQSGSLYVKPVGLEEAELEDYTELNKKSKRKKSEIDITVPVNVSAIQKEGCMVLPTHLGFRANAISFFDECGNQLPAGEVVIKQDAIGLTYLQNIDPNVNSVQYRLKKEESKAIKEISDEWKSYVKVNGEYNNQELQDKLSKAKTNREKINIIRTHLINYNPVYSKNRVIQALWQNTRNYFETQKSLGLIGHCEHMATYLANAYNQCGVTSGVAGGLILERDSEGNISFQASSGHAQTLWLDERNIPHMSESTTLRSSQYALDEEKVYGDAKEALAVLDTAQDKINQYFHKKASEWRVTKSNSEFEPTVTEEFLEHLNEVDAPHCEDLEQKERVGRRRNKEHIEDVLFKLNLHVKSLEGLTAKTNFNYLGEQLIYLTTICMTYGTDYLSIVKPLVEYYGMRLEDIDYETARKINNLKPEEFLDEFKDFYFGPKTAEVLRSGFQEQLLEELIDPDPTVESHYHQFLYQGKMADRIFKLLNKEQILNLNPKKLQRFKNILLYSKLDHDFKSKLLLDIAKTEIEKHGAAELRVRDFNYINDFLYEEPSSEALKNYFEYIRLYGEEYLEEFLISQIIENIDQCPNVTSDVIKDFYSSGVLEGYFQKDGNKVVLTKDFSAKVAKKLKQHGFCERGHSPYRHIMNQESYNYADFIKDDFDVQKHLDNLFSYTKEEVITSPDETCEYYGWHIPHDIKAMLEQLENMGVDLRKHISPEEATWIINPKVAEGWSEVFHKWERISTSRPVDYILASYDEVDFHVDFHNEESFDASEYIGVMCEYFGVDVNDLPSIQTQKELWKEKLEPILAGRSDFELCIPVTALSKDQFMAISCKGNGMKRFLDWSGLDLRNTIERKIFESLYKQFPEAKDLVHAYVEKEYLSEPHKSYVDTVQRLVDMNTTKATQYRFTVLLDILRFVQNKQLQNLKKELKNLFVKGAASSNQLLAIYNPFSIVTTTFYYELKNLTEHELRVFSAVLADENLDIDTCANIFGKDSYLVKDYKNRTHNVADGYWSGCRIEELQDLALLGNRYEQYEHWTEIGRYARAAEEFFKMLSTGSPINFDVLLRKGFVPFNDTSISSGVRTQGNEDLDRLRGYVPGDDVRRLSKKELGKDKLIICERTEPAQLKNVHYIVDLDWLLRGDPKKIIPENLQRLYAVLYAGQEKGIEQDIKVLYRGGSIAKGIFLNLGVGKLFSKTNIIPKEFEQLRPRDNFTNRIFSMLRFIEDIHSAKKIETEEKQYGYKPAPMPVSFNERLFDKKGIILILCDDPDKLSETIPIAQKYKAKYGKDIDIRRISLRQ